MIFLILRQCFCPLFSRRYQPDLFIRRLLWALS
jgi:hypothetical protein